MTGGLGRGDLARMERLGMVALSSEGGLGLFDAAVARGAASVARSSVNARALRCRPGSGASSAVGQDRFRFAAGGSERRARSSPPVGRGGGGEPRAGRARAGALRDRERARACLAGGRAIG